MSNRNKWLDEMYYRDCVRDVKASQAYLLIFGIATFLGAIIYFLSVLFGAEALQVLGIITFVTFGVLFVIAFILLIYNIIEAKNTRRRLDSYRR